MLSDAGSTPAASTIYLTLRQGLADFTIARLQHVSKPVYGFGGKFLNRSCRPISTVCLLCLLPFAQPTMAQLKTIPEQLAQAGHDLKSGATVPSGRAPEIEFVLQQTDLIVRGIVGEPKSYLSNDQTDIFSDYPIKNPTVIFDILVARLPQPFPIEIVVTIEGGTVTVSGLKFTMAPGALPNLRPGSECLLLLKRVKDKFHIAGWGYLGAFQILDNKLTALTGVRTFGTEYRGMEAPAAISSIVSRRQLIKK